MYDDDRQTIRYPLLTTHSWLDKTRQAITASDIPYHLNPSPSYPLDLCFWTSTATLKVQNRGWDSYHHEPRIILSSPDGSHEFAGLVGRGVLTTGAEQTQDIELPEDGKFIVIGAAKQRMSHGGKLTLKLLMVDVDYDAEQYVVCTRKYLVTEVMEDAWEKLQNARKWKIVFLG